MVRSCYEEELVAVWPFVIRDAANNFVFDVIDYEDYRHNLPVLTRQLARAIESGQYTPEPLWRVDIPKNPYSVRPGAVMSPADMLVLYALLTRIAGALDVTLRPGVFSYRFKTGQAAETADLFGGVFPDADVDQAVSPYEVTALADVATAFPAWYAGWRDFHRSSKEAAAAFPYVAQADIAGFFEHISVATLRKVLREILRPEEQDAAEALCGMLEFWGIAPFAGPSRAVLPQGNDASLFLSNFAILELDRALGDEPRWRYLRYVDDIRVFVTSQDEGRRALLACEAELRKLNFNLQTEKTKLSRAADLFDAEVEAVCEGMAGPDGYARARAFWAEGRWREDLGRWERAYLRALAVLAREGDDTAFDDVLAVFLENASYKLLVRNFHYLYLFGSRHNFATRLAARLDAPAFLLPYHRYYILRLGAYSREDCPALREAAWHELRRRRGEWYCRYAALFLLNTFDLTDAELEEIYEMTDGEPHPAVIRAALVALRQRPEGSAWSHRDTALFGFKRGHESLFFYFNRLATDAVLGRRLVRELADADLSGPAFLRYLHICDVLRGNGAVRREMRSVLETKLAALDADWTRLRRRLAGILRREEGEFVAPPLNETGSRAEGVL